MGRPIPGPPDDERLQAFELTENKGTSIRRTLLILTIPLLAPLAGPASAADLTQDSPVTFPAKGALSARSARPTRAAATSWPGKPIPRVTPDRCRGWRPKNTAHLLVKEHLLVTGGLSEMLPEGRRDEGCSDADWLRLNLMLWETTRQSRYLEQAERTLFNQFAMTQFSGGDFGHNWLAPKGLTGMWVSGWACCTLHGLRAFPDVFRAAFHADRDGLSYGLPVDAQGESHGLALQAVSTLARDRTVRIQVLRAPSAARPMAIRVPPWAKAIEVKVNGEPMKVTPRDGRIVLERDWKPEEAVELCYQLASRIERRPDKSGQLALFHGPWLLQIDRVTSPVFFESGYGQNRVVLPSFESEGDIALEPARPTEVPIGPFRVPVARFKLTFIPGGFRSQPLMATLSAAAERTAQDVPPLAEFWLELRKEGETFTNY